MVPVRLLPVLASALLLPLAGCAGMAGRGPEPQAAMPAPASPEAAPTAASRGADDEAEPAQAAPTPAKAHGDALTGEAAAEGEAGRHPHHEASHEAAAEKAEEAHDHASEATLRIVEEPAPPSEPVPPPPARALPAEEVAARVRPEVERGDAVIAGRVELIQVHPVPAGPGQLQRTWVAFRPNRGRHRAAPMEEQRIITRQSQFQPQALMITAGTTVRFPNYDRIQHNVFSLSEGNRFDVGLYGPGEGVAHTFLNPGLVYVYCNIHPNMAAFLWVVDTPYFAQIDMDGTFRIEGVPRGGGILEVWNHRAELYRFPVVAPDQNVRIALRITKPPVLQHTNKFGRPY